MPEGVLVYVEYMESAPSGNPTLSQPRKYAGIGAQAPLRLLEDEELERVADACRNFRLALLGTEGFDCAQVTAGGIKTGGFDPETLESWFMPRLFVCGELLDVDGDCGGYNLQWAWASGRLAGRLGK